MASKAIPRDSKSPKVSRRRFVAGAAAASGVAAISAPAIAASRGPQRLRWQSAWREDDPAHEHAVSLATRLDTLSGGELRIEVRSAGPGAAAGALLDAVLRGAIDGAHGTVALHVARHPAFALWGAGPAFGMDAHTLLAWHRYGGGQALLERLYAQLGARVVSFLHGPLPTEPLGWFDTPVTAADAGAADGPRAPAEFNDPTSARRRGLAKARKVCMLQSYHRSAAQLELLLHRPVYDSLAPRLRALIAAAVDAASADVGWRSLAQNARDAAELEKTDGVRFYRTPHAVLERQLADHDAAARALGADALGEEIARSQRAFAERAVRWQLEAQVSPRLAYNHYFRGRT